jgi:hypothetical protein
VDISPPDFEDDPENGVFWSPPDGLVQRRWSRAWFDWRSEGEQAA